MRSVVNDFPGIFRKFSEQLFQKTADGTRLIFLIIP